VRAFLFKFSGLFFTFLFIVSIIIFAVDPLPAKAQTSSVPPEITAGADKDKVTIADTINYTVTVKASSDTEIIQEPGQDKIGVFFVRDLKHKQTKDKQNNQIFTFSYQLAAFEVGKLAIPGYKIQYKQKSETEYKTILSPPLEITVESVVGEDKDIQIKPLKPKIGVWQSFWLRLLLGLIGAALIILLFIVLRKRKKEKSQIPVFIPAHIIAYRELEQLRNLNLLEKGQIEKYFEMLSGCLRRYLENRFNLRAPLMSTEEFLIKAKSSSSLNTEQKKSLKGFLQLSDLVKFARYGSSVPEAEGSYEAAKNFIDQTKQEDITETSTDYNHKDKKV